MIPALVLIAFLQGITGVVTLHTAYAYHVSNAAKVFGGALGALLLVGMVGTFVLAATIVETFNATL